MKEKNRYEEEEPRSRKRKVFDVEKIWNEKKAFRDEELKLREKELELRGRELSLQEKRAQQAEDMNCVQMEMMQKQMQQMADLITLMNSKK